MCKVRSLIEQWRYEYNKASLLAGMPALFAGGNATNRISMLQKFIFSSVALLGVGHLKPDSTADSILKWANSCRSWGIGLSIFYAFIGLISGIISSSAALDIGMSGFSAFISEFLPAIVISVFIYLGLSAISLLLTALAKIVQYTRQTAAFTELQTRKIFNKKSEVTIDVLDDFDEKTDDEMREEDEEDHINEVGGIVCPKCKQTIAADSEFCYYCGETIK